MVHIYQVKRMFPDKPLEREAELKGWLPNSLEVEALQITRNSTKALEYDVPLKTTNNHDNVLNILQFPTMVTRNSS